MMKPSKAIVYLFIIGVLITGIYTDGYAQNKISDGQVRESYAKSADVYTKAEVNATVESAIAAIPAASVNITLEATAAETIVIGDVVSLLNTNDVITVKKTDNTNVAGIAQNSCDTSEACIVLLKGTDANQSGLVTGALYYRQADYSIDTDAVSINGSYIFVGYAKSATEIVLD